MNLPCIEKFDMKINLETESDFLQYFTMKLNQSIIQNIKDNKNILTIYTNLKPWNEKQEDDWSVAVYH